MLRNFQVLQRNGSTWTKKISTVSRRAGKRRDYTQEARLKNAETLRDDKAVTADNTWCENSNEQRQSKQAEISLQSKHWKICVCPLSFINSREKKRPSHSEMYEICVFFFKIEGSL